MSFKLKSDTKNNLTLQLPPKRRKRSSSRELGILDNNLVFILPHMYIHSFLPISISCNLERPIYYENIWIIDILFLFLVVLYVFRNVHNVVF